MNATSSDHHLVCASPLQVQNNLNEFHALLSFVAPGKNGIHAPEMSFMKRLFAFAALAQRCMSHTSKILLPQCFELFTVHCLTQCHSSTTPTDLLGSSQVFKRVSDVHKH